MQDLRLLLGVLGCPLAPCAPLTLTTQSITTFHQRHPNQTSSAHYIIQQYLAATGCLKKHKCVKNMYAMGTVKMMCWETEIASGKSVRSVGTRGGDNGCFVLWQMSPGMWSVSWLSPETKSSPVVTGKIVGDIRPGSVLTPPKALNAHYAASFRYALSTPNQIRLMIHPNHWMGLDPKSSASLFAKAQCLGEKRIGDEDCFVLKVAADRAAVMERSEGPAEVIRHVLYGYFSQRSGLLIYMEDSHLTRVQAPESDAVYWETTNGSSVEDYRDIDGLLIAHQGRTVATVFRFGEVSMQHSRTRMEEAWRIDDVVFNVPGLSVDHFIPPADLFDAHHSP
ncbi:hypothetical protein HHK36_004625 [Tetracentron sinense]|uniref:DUF620 domain-containing protein n=1 Tax=Tetracentron sinense TaxID=13715 RepID=A0A834ZU12_TETSI|nr:hypothetical protein HHK36_004625 [Tetracentron sinense]